MHELAITESIVEAVADRVGDAKVWRIVLEVGQLSGVVAEAVRFCFDVATEGTRLEGAKLEIVHVPGRGKCRDCGARVARESPIVLCACGSADVMIETGRELRIREVEVS